MTAFSFFFLFLEWTYPFRSIWFTPWNAMRFLFNSSAAQSWCLIYPKHQSGWCTSWQIIKKKKWLCKALFVLLIWSTTKWERHLYEYESSTLLCTHCNLVSISALAVQHWLDYTTTSSRAFSFLHQPITTTTACSFWMHTAVFVYSVHSVLFFS